ncbi:hypothetical protein SSTU70S_01302 [Stutzerimonas stutzeri]
MPLTNEQKKHYKSIGHHLKPVLIVAENGLSEGVLAELERALNDHELIKVQFRIAEREDRHALMEELCKVARLRHVESRTSASIADDGIRSAIDAGHSVVLMISVTSSILQALTHEQGRPSVTLITRRTGKPAASMTAAPMQAVATTSTSPARSDRGRPARRRACRLRAR